jgi:hypothetical protein
MFPNEKILGIVYSGSALDEVKLIYFIIIQMLSHVF